MLPADRSCELDGEWISSVVDDRLCLKFHEDQRHFLLSLNPDDTSFKSRLPKKFLKTLSKGPDALFFASCRDTNETWLPLLEKAYAKAHLSYQSIEAGWPGEGIEDLTGGVNSSIRAEDILDKERLWSELERVNEDFLFGCGSRTALYADQQDYETSGVVTQHAYTVLSARTVKYTPRKEQTNKTNRMKRSKKQREDSDGDDDTDDEKEKTVRLLKIRNPWGEGEWTGAW